MANSQRPIILRHLRKLMAAQGPTQQSDMHLLQQFIGDRDETAFAAIVNRHGNMVLGVCRSVLQDHHDAEDAFQAVFLVLARQAHTIRKQMSLSSWLHGVAYRLSLKARTRDRRRRDRGGPSVDPTAPHSVDDLTVREMRGIVLEELDRLGARYRTPLVLCYWEGKTRDEAAEQLGMTSSAFKKLLEQARILLGKRLARRGLAPSAFFATLLSANGMQAALPGVLIKTTARTAMAFGAGENGGGSVPAASLANGVIQSMNLTRWAVTIGTVLLLATLGTGLSLAAYHLVKGQTANEPGKAIAAATGKQSGDEKQLSRENDAEVADRKPAPEDAKKMNVSGQILDADGKPLAGAEVALLGVPDVALRGGDLSSRQPVTLGSGKTDSEGRFRLDLERTSSAHFVGVAVVAGRSGYAVGWQALDPDAEKSVADFRLAPEQVIRARFVDVQNQPAAGVAVRISAVRRAGRDEFAEVAAPTAGKEPAAWPKAAITDKDGRIEIHGVGREVTVTLGMRDDRFATQTFAVANDGTVGAGEVLETLEAAHLIEGTVTYADTGKVVPGAGLTVYAGNSATGSLSGMAGRADEKGRFRLNPSPGNYFHVSAYAPDGEPYLTLEKRIQWPRAAVKQQVDLSLPRGVLVRGTVTEGGTGKAVAKAVVQFIPRHAENPHFRRDVLTGSDSAVVSGDDGQFDICVLPGPGHLLIHGPTRDYVFAEIGDAKLLQGKEGGIRYYAHAILALDLKPDAGVHDVAATLKHAITVKGQVVGPDGKPIAEALMVSRLAVDPATAYWRGSPVVVCNGRFELHGCDPEKRYPVFFLDARHKLGATVELSGKQGGEAVTVRLLPCGEAVTRLVDADGKARAGQILGLELVVTPGPSRNDLKKVYETGQMAADADYVANIDRLNYRNGRPTDAEGRVTFPALIPGATYRIVEIGDKDDMVKCEFKAESGKTVKLPDVVRKKGG